MKRSHYIYATCLWIFVEIMTNSGSNSIAAVIYRPNIPPLVGLDIFTTMPLIIKDILINKELILNKAQTAQSSNTYFFQSQQTYKKFQIFYPIHYMMKSPQE